MSSHMKHNGKGFPDDNILAGSPAGQSKMKNGVRDPILTEIINGHLVTTSSEMAWALTRSAYSTMVKESNDASCALLDSQAQLVAQSPGTLLAHLCSLRELLRELIVDYPIAQMQKGDIFVANDPYRGGIHSNDIAVFRPFFLDDSVGFFSGALIHVADLGGVSGGGLPAQATDTFHEGLLIPPMRLGRNGVVDTNLVRLLSRNSRTPDKLRGDLYALTSATFTAQKRMTELVARYGGQAVRDAVSHLIDYTENRTREEILSLPSGKYSGALKIDDDGVDKDRSFRVQLTIERRASDLTIDLTGTSEQARGPINASYSQSFSGAVYGARCLLDPTIPLNEGALRPIKVNLPRGSLVNPNPPAAVNARIVTVAALIEAILEAHSKMRPNQAVASSSINHVYAMSGDDPRAGEHWVLIDNDFGGIGARANGPGPDATGPYFFTGRSSVVQLETVEAEFPVIYRKYALIRDSGGRGRWFGGRGVEKTIEPLTEVTVSMRCDRIRHPPAGRLGGSPGKPGSWIVNLGTDREQLLASKHMGLKLHPGDTLTMRTSGGGGLGREE